MERSLTDSRPAPYLLPASVTALTHPEASTPEELIVVGEEMLNALRYDDQFENSGALTRKEPPAVPAARARVGSGRPQCTDSRVDPN